MKAKLPFPLLDSPAALARCNGWTEEVYRDLLALQSGQLDHGELDRKYLQRKAILTLDLTGFTAQAMNGHHVHAFLRILDAQRVCVPVFHEYESVLVRAFADDLVGLFDDPGQAVDAAFEMHRRIAIFNDSVHASMRPALCCIGIGYGDVYAIGPNLAMGDEMNRASKLGEDTARGNETLVTSNVYEALKQRSDVVFEQLASDDQLFAYYRASPTS
jgi:class 3 adenylate cyclase